MKLTSLDIEQQQFSMRFRGYATQEVDAFLEQLTDTVQQLHHQIESLMSENQTLKGERKAFLQRAELAEAAMVDSKKLLEKSNEDAHKAADLIIAAAEVRAEKILNRAHNRLAQLHDDINELKRQRMQIELQIRHIIENHTRVLDLKRENMKVADEEYAKIRLLRHSA